METPSVPPLPAPDPEVIPGPDTTVQIVVHPRHVTATRNYSPQVSLIVHHRQRTYGLVFEGPGRFALQELGAQDRIPSFNIPFDYRDPEATVQATIDFMQDTMRLDFLKLPRLPRKSLIVN